MSDGIEKSGTKYHFLKRFVVDPTLKRSYRRYQVEGRENIPTDGSVVWATNHSNALMDALVLLAANSKAKVFIARADIFKKRAVVKILTFLKIMPMYRIRDGFDSVKQNDVIIERAIRVMESGTPLVIFPEATHRTKHSLLRLSKGIFHITQSLYEKSVDGKPIYIQPVGIEYGDYFRFRSTVLVRFGKPINVSEFLKSNSQLTIPQQMQSLRETLTQRLSELITFIPDDDDYDAIWELTKLRADNRLYYKNTISSLQSSGDVCRGLMASQAVNRCAVSEILAMRREKPELWQRVAQDVDRLRLWRLQNGISVHSVASDNIYRDVIIKSILALIGAPYYLFSMVLSLPLWLTSIIIVRKIKDDAFYNSARFCIKLALSWLLFIIWVVVSLCTIPKPYSFIFLLFLLPTYAYFSDYSELIRRTASDWRWMLYRKRAPKSDVNFV